MIKIMENNTLIHGMQKSLNRKQFEILTCIEKNGTGMTQREIAASTGLSLGSVNKTMSRLTELSLIDKGSLTEAGYAALEPYRVKRAVFIAAGFGSRMVPITFNTPKPLVRVHGNRIIDSLIDACLANGINEIYIVRGYLAEDL